MIKMNTYIPQTHGKKVKIVVACPDAAHNVN